MKIYKGKGGFTLIELVIVMSIISILAMVAVPNYHNYRQSARDAAIKTLLAEIGSLQREYASEKGTYLACPLNPPSADGKWQNTGPWKELDFKPMQDLFSYQFKVDAGRDYFTAFAIKDGEQIFAASNSLYDIQKLKSAPEKPAKKQE